MFMNVLEPVTAAHGTCGCHDAHRPGRHRIDQFLRAVQRGPPVRLAGPHLGRTCVERRHLRQRLRRAQLRPCQPAAACTALRKGQRVRRRGERAVEQLGRRRLHPRPHQRTVLRPDAPACRPPRGQVLQGRRRPQHRPLAARPSGDHPGRASDTGLELAARTAELGVRQRVEPAGRQARLRRPQGSHGEVRPLSRTRSGSSPACRWSSAARSRRRRTRPRRCRR